MMRVPIVTALALWLASAVPQETTVFTFTPAFRDSVTALARRTASTGREQMMCIPEYTLARRDSTVYIHLGTPTPARAYLSTDTEIDFTPGDTVALCPRGVPTIHTHTAVGSDGPSVVDSVSMAKYHRPFDLMMRVEDSAHFTIVVYGQYRRNP